MKGFVDHTGANGSYGLFKPLIQKPANETTLVVYLHGQGSNYLEPFVQPVGATIADSVLLNRPKIIGIVSCNYGDNWGNDGALTDITAEIRQAQKEISADRIILMGTSMGGCTSLLYAATAPEDIKQKITGVACALAAGDLKKLFVTTSMHEVRGAMTKAFEGTPEQRNDVYTNKSFFSHVRELSPNVKVAIISGLKDTVIPPSFQNQLMKSLKKNRNPAKLIETNEAHIMPKSLKWNQAFDFVLYPLMK